MEEEKTTISPEKEKSIKGRFSGVRKSRWIRFSIACIAYIAFAIWLDNYYILPGLLVLLDIYITRFIPWTFWKKSKNKATRKTMEWVDAILYALVAVYLINTFFFQNYKIPSSSLEKTLLVGDYLFVSKLSFGPRVPNTPLSFPLAQHTMPVINTKSYIEWPQWPYHRLKGLGQVERNDKYLNAGIRAVREIQADIPIMIHLDNGGFNEMYVEWFDEFTKRAEPFDIIGLSYYPFWHGTMEQLEFNMRDMARRYGKKLVIAETSMGFTMEDYRDREGKPLDQLKGMATKPELVEKLDYPMTKEGQASFMKDLMKLIADIPGGEGFYYWEPAWIPVPGCGWATEAALAYTGEKGPGGNEWANQALFDYDGNALPALDVIRDFNRQNCK